MALAQDVLQQKHTTNRPRSFFDSMDKWSKDQGASVGMA